MSFSDELQFVVDLARSAGEIVLRNYGNAERLTKTHAAASDEAVTESDRAVQRHIVAGLRKRFPTDGIIGEESDSGKSITFECTNASGRNWVIDPIDGTNNYIVGLGLFGICIGLLDAGMPSLGVVYDVTRDALYCAATQEGAWLNQQRIRAASTPLSDFSMVMLTSNLLDAEGKVPSFVDRWFAQTNWKIRILGSAAIEAVQVAAGVAHGAITINGKLWDVAAPAAIAIEAGAVVSDLSGNPLFPFELGHYAGAKVPFLIAGPRAHRELLENIRRA